MSCHSTTVPTHDIFIGQAVESDSMPLSMDSMLESLLAAGGQNNPDQDEALAQQALLGQNNIADVQPDAADKAIAKEAKKEV